MDFGFTNSSPDPALCTFAAKTLRKRVRALVKEQNGVREARDLEYVHRMRVASRRLNVALTLFEPCFPARRFKAWHKDIRTLRRALGEARDCDVQIEFLEQLVGEISPLSESATKSEHSSFIPHPSSLAHLPGIVRILLRKKQRRDRLQSDVIKALNRFDEHEIAHDIRAALIGLHDSDDESAESTAPASGVFAFAATAVQESLDELLQLESCVEDPARVSDHHAMRIAAKHLRYLLEIFVPLFPEKLEFAVSACKHCQTLLGDIHDADVWIDYIPGFLEKERARTVKYFGHEKPLEPLLPGIQFLEQHCQNLRHEKFTAFQSLWRELRARHIWEQLLIILSASNQSGTTDNPESSPSRLTIP